MSKVISAQVPDALYGQIEEIQEPDESRSAAVRRVVRAGVDDLVPPSITDRLVSGLSVLVMFLFPVVAAWEHRLSYAVGYVSLLVLLSMFGPEFDSAVGQIKQRLP